MFRKWLDIYGKWIDETADEPRRFHALAVLLLLVMAVGVFAHALFSGGELIVSGCCDIVNQYAHSRAFVAAQLLDGNIPLWNPYMYAGSTFIGDPQCGIFYPVNLIYLFLPLRFALNLEVVLHLFLAGLGMYCWLIARRIHPLAAFTGATAFMFGGAYFINTFPGPLPLIASAAWTPWLFWVIEKYYHKPKFKWLLTGIFFMAMSILGGHVQNLYFSLFALGLYSTYLLILDRNKWHVLPLFLCIFIGGLALSMVQFLPAHDFTSVSYRSIWESIKLVEKPFYVENLISLLSYNFFGDYPRIRIVDVAGSVPYWGYEFMVEETIYIGVAMFLMIVHALRRQWQKHWPLLLITFVLFILAMGENTFLFPYTTKFIPYFDIIGSHGKFIFQVCLFLIVLASHGIDQLIRKPVKKQDLYPAGILMLLVLLGGIIIQSLGTESWRGFVDHFRLTDRHHLNEKIWKDAGFLAASQSLAAAELFWAAGKVLLFGGILLFIIKKRVFALAVSAFAVIELLVFAFHFNYAFDSKYLYSDDLQAIAKNDKGSYTIFSKPSSYKNIQYGLTDISGDNTVVVGERYYRFMVKLIEDNSWLMPKPGHFTLARRPNMLKLLRMKYLIVPQTSLLDRKTLMNNDPIMPELSIINDIGIEKGPDKIIEYISHPGFDPSRHVILETEPEIVPGNKRSQGSAEVVERGTDYLIIRADVPQNSLLYIAKPYNKDWRAMPEGQSAQSNYTLMPANYTFMAIPLFTGRHRIRLEYHPDAYYTGMKISLIALLIYLILLLSQIPRIQKYVSLGYQKISKIKTKHIDKTDTPPV